MNPPVSALRPASDVPAEEAALDGALAHLRDVIGVLDLAHLDRLSGDGVLSVLSKTASLARGIESILAAASAEVAVRSDSSRGSEGLAARLNYARPSHLIEVVAGVSAATAGKLIRVGARAFPRMSDSGLPLPPLFPAVGSALRAGVIGVETAEVITRELTLAAPRAAVDDLVAAEHALVGQAAGGADIGLPKSPDLIAVQARQWRDHLDPEGIEPRAEKAFKERDFWVSRTATNGLFTFGGRVTVDVGGKLHALFNSILSPRTAPRYRADEEAAVRTAAAAEVSSVDGNEATATAGETDPTGTAVPGDDARAKQSAPRDLRTPGQIRADVFAAMIDSLSRSGDAPTITGAAPTVVVSVTAEILKNEKGTGTIVGVSEPVPYSAIKQILCDGSTIPAILDSDGALVGLGTENRLFNRAHRMGMIARDGPTCGVEGCDIPATGCEAHHIIEHAEGGPTHTDNGALYCWFHHRMIDTGVFTVTMVDGRPQVTYPEWLQRKPYFQ